MVVNSVEIIRYQEHRLSVPLITFALLLEAGIAVSGTFYGFTLLQPILGVLVLLLLGLVFDLTITVGQHVLHLSFGVGLFSREIGLAEIESFRIPQNHYLLPWLYAPQSEHTLLLGLRSGRRLIVPSASPKELQEVLMVKNI